MNASRALRFVAAVGSLFAACASSAACSSSHDATSSTNGAMTAGSPAEAKACAVRDAYLNAGPNDVTSLQAADLPSAVQATLGSQATPDALSKMEVPSVGGVYIVQQTVASETTLSFLDANGTGLVNARLGGDGQVAEWDNYTDLTGSESGGAPIQCSEQPPASDGPGTLPDQGGSSGSDPTGATDTSGVTASIDGQALHVDGVDLWAPNPSDPSEYDLFVKVSGPGVASGSDIAITAHGVGTCAASNWIAFRPTDDSQYMPASDATSDCGLNVSALPQSVGDRFTGSFDGDLFAINDPSPSAGSKHVVVSFDVARTK